MGTATAKDPKAHHESFYNKKQKPDGIINIDPRPAHLRRTTQEELNTFHISHQAFDKTPNFIDLLRIKYKNYTVDDERKQVLVMLRKQFLKNLSQCAKYDNDVLSNSAGVHVTGTELQSSSENWMKERALRVTASKFLEFDKNPVTVTTDKLWKQPLDLSHVPAIKWGREHEQDAIKVYETQAGSTQKCGLFISRAHPFLGASPDGINGEYLIEIKCPFVLRDCHPSDLETLNPNQRSGFFCTKENGQLKLKQKHAYFWQIQCQMYVTGFKKTHFVV
jgi:hypothetical protein